MEGQGFNWVNLQGVFCIFTMNFTASSEIFFISGGGGSPKIAYTIQRGGGFTESQSMTLIYVYSP